MSNERQRLQEIARGARDIAVSPPSLERAWNSSALTRESVAREERVVEAVVACEQREAGLVQRSDTENRDAIFAVGAVVAILRADANLAPVAEAA